MCNSPDLDEPRCPSAKPQTIRELLFHRVAPACAVWVLLTVSAPPAQAAADLYIKDTPADTGAEPNPDPGPMWVSEDIWVRQNPFPGHQPYPFTVDPAWLTAIVPLHQNPEYRDPKYSKPNYVYVRVRNRGDAASTGTERLRVYWAKASTGLSWPSQWVDYIAANCGPNKLYGIEITKPRRNVADLSVPQSAVDDYRDAIVTIGTVPTYQFPDGVQYWHKQNAVHSHVVNYGSLNFTAHGSDAFLPWHREYVSRYETLLREANPTVTLFYWDWTTDPRSSARITGLMGSFAGPIGLPFSALAPPSVSRATGTSFSAPTPTATSDATIVGQATFSGTRVQNESPAHNRSHVFVGGDTGNISSLSTAAQDPFFFLIHGDADRLWAMWQRQDPSRYDPAAAFTGTMAAMTVPMAPWNGLRYNGSAATLSNPANGISPWTTTDGYIMLKRANDPSVVFPPIYDTAPLTIPALLPGESVVIEIPWYPPNPADFSCFGADQGHVCLLARIETSASPPYGMTFAEGSDVFVNTKNNNNIAWKNLTVEDSLPGPLIAAPIWLRNLSLQLAVATRLDLSLPPGNENVSSFADVLLDLKPELFARWVQTGAISQGFERVGGTTLRLIGTNAFVANILLFPNEAQPVEVQLRLHKGYPNPQGQVFAVDLQQSGAPDKPTQLIGGQRFRFDFNKLCLVPERAQWRYWDAGTFPGQSWPQLTYDDSQWKHGPAKLGFGDGNEATVIDGGPPGARHITTWFRNSFALEDPTLYGNLWLRLKADDGAVVYLNGVEIARLRMPVGVAITPDTLASQQVGGLLGELYYPFNVSSFLQLLRASNNVVAVEVHQASPDSPDLGFDLELCANLGTLRFPPRVAFLAPPDSSLHLLGQPIKLVAEAVSPVSTEALSVTFYSDGQPLGSVGQTPYTLVWSNAPPGRHQLTAEVRDVNGLKSSDFITLQVLKHLPPIVTITNPIPDQMFTTADQIPFDVDAYEIGGSIQRVDFYRKAHLPTFNEPEVFLGTRTKPPYSLQMFGVPAGHQLLTAVATDTFGAASYSVPVLIQVVFVPQPVVAIRYAPPSVIIDWTPSAAILEQAPTVTGPWQPVSGASPPFTLVPTSHTMFFRARLP